MIAHVNLRQSILFKISNQWCPNFICGSISDLRRGSPFQVAIVFITKQLPPRCVLGNHEYFTEAIVVNISDGVGAPDGIVAGQAWECETKVALSQYQRAKTGALFVAATCAGALAAGVDPAPWRALGEALGEAYQVADDIRDVMGQAETLGKPVGQDAQHGRPSAAKCCSSLYRLVAEGEGLAYRGWRNKVLI